MNPKKILLAIDHHDSSKRAVEYVGRIVAGCPDFEVTIIHIIEDPSEDYFEDDHQREEYLQQKKVDTDQLLDRAKNELVSQGFPADRVHFMSPVKTCDSMASCIIEESEEYGTLVVGRRGISKSQEFLFGSVSKKIVDYARKCTVWVVE